MSRALRYNILVIAAAALLFVPFLGAVHLFDWDEINFAECAREMLVTQDFFSVRINYQPFWEKPPLFIWMQAGCMNIFGINEFAARLPDAICGIITLSLLFNIGRKLVDERFGLIWALAYAGSFLPHFYFKSGIIDPWFNLFIFSGIYYFILFTNNNNTGNRQLVLSALFIGLGIMTKGPVAFLIFALCFGVYWAIKRFKANLSPKQWLMYAAALVSVGGLWFLMLALTGHSDIIIEFFLYQVRLLNTEDAGHGGPFYYHWIVLLIGCFPVSVFALRAFRKSGFDTPFQGHFRLWMLILFFVVLILFSLVKTKIIHYSSLCYFPLSFLGAYAIHKLLTAELQWKKYSGVLLLVLSSVIGIALSALPVINMFKEKIIAANIIKDEFAVENLKADVHWSGFEWMLGLFLIAGTVLMVFMIRRKKLQFGIAGIFIVSLVTVNLATLIITPKIEPYSQGAAIEFYQYLKGKDCYVETLGYKSYAQLFYSEKQAPSNPASYDIEWLCHGKLDKPAYFVSKITYVEDVRKYYPELKEIYRKNGFVFWKRN
jgi:hypothetical protein